MDESKKAGMAYHVSVTRRDEAHAIAKARGHTLLLNVKKGDGSAGFNAAETLLAAGRVGNLDSLGLDVAGIATAGKFIAVDDQLATSQPHIWTIGDAKGGLMFTHVATYDGPLAVLNAVKGLGKTVDYRVLPRAMFSDPTLTAVGLTEAATRAQGLPVKIGSVAADGARAKAIGESRGRLKAVVHAETDEILGFHILAPHGDDLLHETVGVMHRHGTIQSIHVHPTLNEMVKAAAKAAR